MVFKKGWIFKSKHVNEPKKVINYLLVSRIVYHKFLECGKLSFNTSIGALVYICLVNTFDQKHLIEPANEPAWSRDNVGRPEFVFWYHNKTMINFQVTNNWG